MNIIVVTQRGLCHLAFIQRPAQPHVWDADDTTLIQRQDGTFWATAGGGGDHDFATGPTPEVAVQRAFAQA